VVSEKGGRRVRERKKITGMTGITIRPRALIAPLSNNVIFADAKRKPLVLNKL
jgi:hypothetical protein